MSSPLHAAGLKSKAAELEFDACGIAAADDIDPTDHLAQWLAAGYHADMHWMERTRDVRRDIQLKLPGAQSVIVLARNYFIQRPESGKGQGRVSRYAWGRDYHRVLQKPVRALARYIEERCAGSATYCCIDSGPVMEKAWAVRAGLGWIGKNSLVLRRELGSYFFLGVILTTAEFDHDSPIPDQCGSCRLCIDACPTAAIVDARIVDSRRCISYQTIENKGAIPEELHDGIGDWVFGCDECQDVCPWNRRLGETTETDFLPRLGHANPSLAEIESLTEADFFRQFAGTPVMRAKMEGLRRNAIIARKNAGHLTGD
ncbi:MAG: tRNA epoxyqueuosine(34) reductase QueG [Candidatus Hydrogenedentes bacterium]|nr:tRNA epoxyqueuosine(34) reductase QueG [Candidatus Hydrogenedentota bacterium]